MVVWVSSFQRVPSRISFYFHQQILKRRTRQSTDYCQIFAGTCISMDSCNLAQTSTYPCPRTTLPFPFIAIATFATFLTQFVTIFCIFFQPCSYLLNVLSLSTYFCSFCSRVSISSGIDDSEPDPSSHSSSTVLDNRKENRIINDMKYVSLVI